jgi:putative ABC transport system ATP-binding protein
MSPEADKPSKKAIVSLRKIRKTYSRGKQEISVLDGIDLDIEEGAFEALMGPSGSGKTTLLNLIAGIDRPTSGTLQVVETDITRLSEGDLAAWRARHIGFIFQFYNLLPVLTAFGNVELPLLLTKLSRAERRQRVETALKVVGLEDRMDHYPRQLSGGQEQRVAIARAIVTDPSVLVADEPTGDLDRKSADEILKLLGLLHSKFKKTIVMVTHDPAAAEHASIIRKLDKGLLAGVERGAH